MYFYDYIDKFIDSFNVFTTCISICDKFFVMICIELNPCYRGRTRSRTIFPFTSYPPPPHTHTCLPFKVRPASRKETNIRSFVTVF